MTVFHIGNFQQGTRDRAIQSLGNEFTNLVLFRGFNFELVDKEFVESICQQSKECIQSSSNIDINSIQNSFTELENLMNELYVLIKKDESLMESSVSKYDIYLPRHLEEDQRLYQIKQSFDEYLSQFKDNALNDEFNTLEDKLAKYNYAFDQNSEILSNLNITCTQLRQFSNALHPFNDLYDVLKDTFKSYIDESDDNKSLSTNILLNAVLKIVLEIANNFRKELENFIKNVEGTLDSFYDIIDTNTKVFDEEYQLCKNLVVAKSS